MRTVLLATATCAVALFGGKIHAAAPALAEQYLHSGELAKGQQALEAALVETPNDDELRFGLGILCMVRGVERLGQSLYEYGVKSENTNVPFVRLPVPTNPDPSTIRYSTFRRILDDFQRDLALAESRLAEIRDDGVSLPIRLAYIQMDLDGDGKPTDNFENVLKKMMRRDPPILEKNPEFMVQFDRGDVAWMRAYCHLLMAMVDFYLAFDFEPQFNLTADEMFARPKHPFEGNPKDKWVELREASLILDVKEPVRLSRFRTHLVKVAELNRETWKYIRAETDDDHEWLPNPKQKGVLGLPVRDEMIDAWLAAVGEVEAVMNGAKVLPIFWRDAGRKGVNLKTVLEKPPESFNLNTLFSEGLPDEYIEYAPFVNIAAFIRVASAFDNTMSVAYAAWFN